MKSPAIILKSKFVVSGSKEYKKFVEYIDREDAKLNLAVDRDSYINESFDVFHTFMDYMDDEDKRGELFTVNKDRLDKSELKKVKEQFNEAQKIDSPMWQDVISFDNDWLEKRGIYNPDKHELNEVEMKNVVRNVMDHIIDKEKMVEPVWSASIHYNTDNIHVHIASVDLNPSHREEVDVWNDKEGKYTKEYRAKRKQGTLDRAKSIVASSLLDRNKDYEKIDSLIREPARKKRNIELSQKTEMESLFLKAIELMPSDLRQWRYGYQTVNDARPYIDEISELYLEEYHQEEYEELITELDKQNEINIELYGEGSSADEYKINKLEELKRSLGNAVIDEMKEFNKRNRSFEKSSYKKKNMSYQQAFWDNHRRINLQRSINELNYRLRKSYHQNKKERDNMAEFERMLEES